MEAARTHVYAHRFFGSSTSPAGKAAEMEQLFPCLLCLFILIIYYNLLILSTSAVNAAGGANTSTISSFFFLLLKTGK